MFKIKYRQFKKTDRARYLDIMLESATIAAGQINKALTFDDLLLEFDSMTTKYFDVKQEHVTTLERKLASGEGEAVKAYADKLLSKINLDTAANRGGVYNSIAALTFTNDEAKEILKESVSNAISAFFDNEKLRQKEIDKKKRAAAKEKRASTASIKTVVENVLNSDDSYMGSSLSDYEKKFLNDIKTKRKLSEKQASWLRSIARKQGVEIKGDLSVKASKSSSYVSCQHEDLGSMGYRHGDTVKCPNCGRMAEVW